MVVIMSKIPVRVIYTDGTQKRVETGNLVVDTNKDNRDWTGLFIRGDDCFRLYLGLKDHTTQEVTIQEITEMLKNTRETENHEFVYDWEWYGKRMDAIQKWQMTLPEPYRTQICDILANGKMREF